MNIIIEQEELQKNIRILKGATQTKVIPILTHFLIDAQTGSIELSATDSEIGIKIKTDGRILEDGTVAVPLKRIEKIVRKLPKEGIQFSTPEDGKIEINFVCGKFTLPTLPAEEFPKMNTVPNEEIFLADTEDIRDAFTKISFAAYRGDKPIYNYLKGVHISIQDGYTKFIAMDVPRLAFLKTKALRPGKTKREFTIPIKAIEVFPKIFKKGELEVGFIEDKIIIANDKITLTAKEVGGDFPDYKTILSETDYNCRIIIETKDILEMVERLYSFAEKSKEIFFDFQDRILKASISYFNFGEATEEIAIINEGKNRIVAFGPNYLQDVLQKIDSNKILFLFKEDSRSGLIIRPIGDDNYLNLIMTRKLE